MAAPSILQLTLLLTLLTTSLSDSTQSMSFTYHKGPLLRGRFTVNLLFYGSFTPAQRAIVTDFISSLSSPTSPNPSVSTWWSSVSKYYRLSSSPSPSLSLSLGRILLDPNYSLTKSLTSLHLQSLAAKSRSPSASASGITVLLTSADVSVEGFCSSRCGTHRVGPGKRPYIWVGNPATQCPGQCAWPFHQPIYGPQGPPLVSPNNDVGVDGMIISLAGLLAGTATNPFGNGFYQGPKQAPLEAASACPGVYGKGAYPGYAGQLLVEPGSGASYNANGVNGRRYLLPALYDPATSTCSTLV